MSQPLPKLPSVHCLFTSWHYHLHIDVCASMDRVSFWLIFVTILELSPTAVATLKENCSRLGVIGKHWESLSLSHTHTYTHTHLYASLGELGGDAGLVLLSNQQRLHKPVCETKRKHGANAHSSEIISQPHPFPFPWAISQHKKQYPDPPPEAYAPPPCSLSSACLLIGSGANGAPTGYEREGCTSLCRAWCACVCTYWSVNTVCHLHMCAADAHAPQWWNIASEEAFPEQSPLACFYVRPEERQAECSARQAAAFPGLPPPSHLLLLHGGNPCWHNAQRTKCWLHPPVARHSPLPPSAVIL